MRIIKVILAVGLTALAIKSCDFEMPFVLSEALEDSKQETKQTKQSLQSVQENYAKQNRELTAILEEISELSCQTTSLQINPENGSRQLTQAEQISEGLDRVKNRIDRLEKEAERARQLDKDMALSVKTIKKLRTTVANQQKEIDKLVAVVSDKDATIGRQNTVISVQKDTISDQMRTIRRQKDELKRSLDRQTEMVYQAGLEFERLGNEADKMLAVSGKKDKEMVRSYKKAIYEKAAECYIQAANMNHAGAKGRSEVISYRIASL